METWWVDNLLPLGGMADRICGGMAQVRNAERTTAAEILDRSLRRGRLGHAYLLSGDELHTLEDFSKGFIRALYCERRKEMAADSGAGTAALDGCGECPQCRKVVSGNHPDVHYLRPESKLRQIRMEPTQEFIRRLQTTAYEGRYKLGWISSIDRMNTQAANAFLKTLEEPPPKTVFILLTTEIERVLDTIISRCLRLHFAGNGELVFPTVARGIVGSLVKRALAVPKLGVLEKYRLLDAVVAGLSELRGEIEEAMLLRSPLSSGDKDLDTGLRDKYEVELSSSIESEYRLQRSRVILAIQWFLRDLWLVRSGIIGSTPAFPEHQASVESLAQRISVDQALANLANFEELQRILHTNVQESLAIEVSFLKLHL